MLEAQNMSLESNLDASEVCPCALAVNKELLLLINSETDRGWKPQQD